MTFSKKLFLFVFSLTALNTVPVFAQEEEVAAEETERTIDISTEAPPSEGIDGATVSHFPALTLGGNGGLMLRNDAPGSYASIDANLDNSWIFAHVRALGSLLGNSQDDVPMSELSGNLHLLAIGISDITWRRYMDNWDFRMLAGFSYTRHVGDVIRVDVNLGFDYFDERFQNIRTVESGLQIGARITARAWQVLNTLSISGYQNVRLNAGGIDLSGTRIICDPATFECSVPPPDPSAAPAAGLLTWQTAGVLISNRTYVWVYRNGNNTFGPELELRFEQLPLVGPRFWAMVSLRWDWTLDHF
jgi:hypothetical protein